MQTDTSISAAPVDAPVDQVTPFPAGQVCSFTDYVRVRRPVLLRTARTLMPNHADAEDLLQTALAKAYQAWDRIDDKRAVEGYVRRTLINTRTSQWRRRRIDEYPTDQLPEPPHTADPAERQALRDALWRAVRRLPPRQQAMVVLRYYEDLSEVQTAEIMGVSVGTVKSAVSRALAKLRLDPSLRCPSVRRKGSGTSRIVCAAC